MKILILFLLSVCIVIILLYGFKKKMILFVCRLIKKKTGFSATISDISFSFKTIRIKQVILEKASTRLEINSVGLSLSAYRLCLCLFIEHFNLYYNSTDQALTNTDHIYAHKTNSVPVKNVLEKLTNLFEKNYPKICRYTLIKIGSLSFFYRDRTRVMLAENLIFEKQKTSFELNNFCGLKSKYQIRLWFKQQSILYAVTNLHTNSLDRLHTTCFKGKIACSAEQQFVVNVHALAMVLNHQKIANQPLTLKNLKVSLIVDQFDDRLELNPESSFQFNDIDLEMKGRYNYQEDLCSILFYLTAQVENLIGLIPDLKVSSLKKFKSEGQICIGISYGFLWSDPLHYKFDVDYDVEELKIINPGIDLSYLQSSFSFKSTINQENHRVLNVEEAANSIENEYLLARIIQMSEDPNFYRHNGVDSYFVGVAIAYNLSQKQFFKGASTLSMQLVKNLFLGEEKSLARKLEELILTLLMENYFKISKERILSVYLQIIELGPDVYGISEAAKFYYNKTAAALNLLDCLVLSYIIPRPRFFLDAFRAKSEQLNHNLSKHIENKLKMLLTNQMITKDTLLAMDKKVVFYNHGEFELTKLDFSNLEHLVSRNYQSLNK